MLQRIIESKLLAAHQGHSTPVPSSFDMQAALVVAAIENFADGLLIVAKTGEVLWQNSCAQTLLKAMNEKLNHQYQTVKTHTLQTLPSLIWRACEALFSGQDVFTPDNPILLEEELEVPTQGRIRLRVKWFKTDAGDCFLVTLEDLNYSLECCTLADAQRYRLTARESEVWQLKRAGYTYKAMAKALYISENTVKKHLKNIAMKREQVL